MAEYEETKKSDRVNSAESACYVERNQAMIDESNYCIFHFNMVNDINKLKGTAIAYKYAKQKGKKIYNWGE